MLISFVRPENVSPTVYCRLNSVKRASENFRHKALWILNRGVYFEETTLASAFQKATRKNQ